MRLGDAPDQLLITHTAPAGTPAHNALRILTSWSAEAPAARPSGRVPPQLD